MAQIVVLKRAHFFSIDNDLIDVHASTIGALGVAIVCSIVSSLYSNQLRGNLPSETPTAAVHVATESVGAAVHLPGPDGATIATVSREAFVHAMSRGSIVIAAVAAIGVLVAWRFLPGRVPDDDPISTDTELLTYPTLEVTR